MNKIIDRFNKIMNVSLLLVIMDIIVGFIFIRYAELSSKLMIVILGCYILIHGLFDLIRYFYDGLGNRIFHFDLVNGIFDSLVGLVAILFPTKTLTVVGVFFGIWLIYNGLSKLFYTYKFMKFNEEIYPLVGFISILMIIMGIVVLINPFSSFMLITKLIGIFTVCYGLFEAMYISLFKKRAKNLLKIFE